MLHVHATQLPAREQSGLTMSMCKFEEPPCVWECVPAWLHGCVSAWLRGCVCACASWVEPPFHARTLRRCYSKLSVILISKQELGFVRILDPIQVGAS
mmetsp:Transcript_52762/g.132728  ORF Transcript_52762/g.132728 Transcript_52762/m.132728 type:complete len:98 (-) Transcript_52762:172-465(-)